VLKLSTEIKLWDYIDPIAFLADHYEAAKSLNDKCSYQRFSDRLGFGETSYSYQMINGRRPISAKTSATIAQALLLDRDQKKYFQAIAQYRFPADQNERDEAMQVIIEIRMKYCESDLDRDLTMYFSEWYHPVIRELFGMSDFKADPQWISAKLVPSITVEQATQSMDLLQKIGFVRFDADSDQWIQNHVNIQTRDLVRSIVLKKYHQSMIELGRAAVTSLSPKSREITATTIAMDPTQFEKMTQMIREFNQQIVKTFSSETVSTASTVYQVNIQAFSLTGDQK
jgi:uncharacterized protein (TIGR02147 family)